MLSRERIPQGEVLQAAYGVLDKFKLNRTFFVKTQQTDCETEAPPQEVVDTTATTKSNTTEETNKKKVVQEEEENPSEDAEGVFFVDEVKKNNAKVNTAPIDDVKANEDFF